MWPESLLDDLSIIPDKIILPDSYWQEALEPRSRGLRKILPQSRTAKLVSVGTVNAPYSFSQDEMKVLVERLFTQRSPDLEKMLEVFDRSEIAERHLVQPMDWFFQPHGLQERNAIYQESATNLSISAVRACLDQVGADFSDFDRLIFVSSTGMATPSIDAILIDKLRLNPHLRRIPIWGLGCLGGAVALSEALEFTRANPKSAVLVIALEFCSLTFQREDLSKNNLVASALFSDGVAAAMVAGEDHWLFNQPGLRLVDSLSTTHYDSLDVMGWDILDTGFKVNFKSNVDHLIRQHLPSAVQSIASRNDLGVKDLSTFLSHPGGPRILDAFEESLHLPSGTLKESRQVLRDHGNMSSPTVLYVANEFLAKRKPGQEGYGILCAFGPGFSSELLLFESC